jgi:hypothetical protein
MLISVLKVIKTLVKYKQDHSICVRKQKLPSSAYRKEIVRPVLETINWSTEKQRQRYLLAVGRRNIWRERGFGLSLVRERGYGAVLLC